MASTSLNRFTGFGILLSVAVGTTAQGPVEVKRRMELTIEKKDGAAVRTVDPTYVFASGDKLRFRLRPAVTGYVYVMNLGSSGTWQQLFPRDDNAQSRRVSSGTDYAIPATGSGWFQVTGPPGYDNVYFLVSPIDLGRTVTAPQVASTQEAESAAFASATPRCDDELFRARGECLDIDAGLKPVQKSDHVPEKFPQVSGTSSRDLIVVDNSKATSVSSSEPFDAPAVYRFKIAHK